MKHTLLTLAAAFLAADSTGSGDRAFGANQQVHETVMPIFRRALPNIPGKALLAAEVEFPPGARSLPHRHPASAVIYVYVLAGEVISAVGEERPRRYQTGESWFEAPGAHHQLAQNASTVLPARLLVVFILDADETHLVTPD